MSDEHKTRITLIGRLSDPDNSEAWEEFEQYYRRFIYYIITRLDVPEDDCDDLAQEILIRLARSVSEYDRTRAGFRNWLGTICRNCVYNYFDKKRRHTNKHRTFEEEIIPLIHKVPTELEDMIESEWKTYITSLALENVKKAFRGNAVLVFEKINEGYSIEETSKELNITENTANVLHSRVRKRLFNEINALVLELEGRDEAE